MKDPAKHSERGQVLPLIAICLAVLMLFAGLAIDAGYWSYQQRQQQNAADAAALGGAQSLLVNGCNAPATVQSAGMQDAALNGYTNNVGGVTVKVNSPATVGPYAGQTCTVSAVVDNPNVSRFFSNLLSPNPVEITTQAVASIVANASGCVYIMNPLLVLQLNAVNIQAPKCSILANSLLVNANASTINVASLGYSQLNINLLNTFTNGTPVQIPPFADPCPEITGCSYLAANPVSYPQCYPPLIVTAALTISQGCYSSLVVATGGALTMNPGAYEFTGAVSQTGGSIVGNGVTLYLTPGAGPVQFNGTNVSLSAPTSGPNVNVLLYQPPNNLNVVNFTVGPQTLSGLIYAPGAVGTVVGTGGGYTVMVFGSMVFAASKTYLFTGPLTGSSIVRNAVLVQ